MQFRALLGVALALIGGGLWASACSAPDPGALPSKIAPRHVSTSGGGSSDDGGSSGGGGSSDGGSTSSSGGSSGGGGPVAFQGAPAYVATVGPSAQKSEHGIGGNPPTNDCFSCHGVTAPEMTMGGRVVDGSGAGVSSAEVRVVDGNGQQVAHAYSDGSGYFYVLGTALSGGPYHVGVRTASAAAGMSSSISKGACAAIGCHALAGTGDVHVP